MRWVLRFILYDACATDVDSAAFLEKQIRVKAMMIPLFETLSQKTELLSARSCQPLNRLNQVFKIVCEVKQTQTENCCDGQGTQVFLRFCLVAEIVCSNNKQNKRVSFYITALVSKKSGW